MTLTDRIVRYVRRARRCPSAYEVAVALDVGSAVVSGLLVRLVNRGELTRFKRWRIYPETVETKANAWVYSQKL